MDPSILPLVGAIVTGALALAGAFAGASYTRRNDYEKWLRQERSIVFAAFLRELYSAQAKAIDVVYSEGPMLSRDIQVSEIFHGLVAHAGIVRLYLEPQERDSFSKSINEFAVAYSPSVDQTVRLRKSESLLKSVQATFERTIGLRTTS